MKMRSLLVLLAGLVLPGIALAVPMTWTYSGVCTKGDCNIVPGISGTLIGDPEINLLGDDDDELTEIVIGEVLFYSFDAGPYNFSGTSAVGSYDLDASGNIVGGSMSFANLFSLEFLDVGAFSWSVIDTDLGLFKKSITKAAGYGSYTLVTKVPEPGFLGLIGAGLFAAGWARRRRSN